jgi:hypothetical protein
MMEVVVMTSIPVAVDFETALAHVGQPFAERIRRVVERSDPDSPLVLANISSANPQFRQEIVALINHYTSH